MSTYWNGKGKHQADYHRLWAKLVLAVGTASTRRGELLRAVSRLYYDHFNNGGCNIQDGRFNDEIKTIEDSLPILDFRRQNILNKLKQTGWDLDEDLELLMDDVIEVVAKSDRDLEEIEGNAERVWEFLNTRWI